LRWYSFLIFKLFQSYTPERKELELVIMYPYGPENPLVAIEVLGVF
jgi:hypothetical protein